MILCLPRRQEEYLSGSLDEDCNILGSKPGCPYPYDHGQQALHDSNFSKYTVAEASNGQQATATGFREGLQGCGVDCRGLNNQEKVLGYTMVNVV